MAQQLEWNESAAAEAPEQGSAFDVLGIVWRRKWAGLCVLVLCLALGYLYFQQAMPIYRSETQLLLIKKDAKVGSEGSLSKASPYGGFEDALSTQMLTLCSAKVIGPAVAERRLADLPSFQGIELEEGAGLNAAVTKAIGLGLKATRAGDRTRPDPNIMNLTFDGPSPEDCQTVLDAVIQSYDEFLKATYHDFSKETLALIQKAKDDLDRQVREKERQLTALRLRMPELIRTRDGETMTLNALRISDIERERSKVKIEQSQSKVLADAIEVSLKNGVDKEAIRFLVRNIQLDQRFSARQTYLDALLRTMLDELDAKEAYGRDHPMVKRAQVKLDYLREQLGSTGADMSDTEGFLKTYLETLRQDVKIADDKVKQLEADAQVESDISKQAAKDQLEEQTLQEEIRRTKLMFDAVVKRLTEMDIVKDYGGITLTRLAEPTLGFLIRPKLPIILAVAGVFGLFAGVGLCYVIELADRSFRSPDDVRRQLGVPIIGHIPVIPAHHNRHGKKKGEAAESPLHPVICTFHQPRGRQAEAYRGVRTSLYFGAQDESHKVIQITSPNPGDGKTTLASNLAVSMADSGKRVLLVDADFRRPKIHKYFGLDNTAGVSTVVVGEGEVLDVILPTAIENLFAMPCGPRPHNPADLLTSPRFKEMIDLVRDKYDFVIVDTPPLLAVTDPSVVASCVDGVLMVLRLTKHAREAALRASELLNSLGAHTLGVVINGVGKGTGYGYGSYRYGRYGYGRYRKGYGRGHGYSYGYGDYGHGGYGYGESAHGNDADSYFADGKTAKGQQTVGGKGPDRPGGKAEVGE